MTAQGALSWSFEERDAHRVEVVLHGLLEDTGAQLALLIDRTGQLIISSGRMADFDSEAFASLAAADFAANDQIAALLGGQEFSTLSHQGARESVHLCDLAGRAILAIVFDGSVTLGMVRIRVKRALPELVAVFQEVFARPAVDRHPGLQGGWSDDAADAIDRAFEGR